MRLRPGSVRFPRRVSEVTQSIRFRLTLLYSSVLFVLAAGGLGVAYVAVERSTDPKPITKRYEAQLVKQKADGRRVSVGTIEVAAVEEIESEVNYRTLQTLRTYSAYALGGLFVLSLGTGWVLSGRALRPVADIARRAQDIQATDLSRRIELRGPRDELRNLAEVIDSMLARLEREFSAQRQLIDDASHELRSPLAVIRASLDTSLNPSDIDEAERREALAVIDRATTRMSRLVEDLLATAQRDAGSLPETDVPLAVVVREAAEDHAAPLAERGLRLELTTAPVTVIGDQDALRRAVGNLISNAVRLAPAGSAVTVAGGVDGRWAWIAVADRGPGIAEADQEIVFDRFWRGETPVVPPAVNGSRERRAGLGLAIVRQIVESHGGRVALHSALGVGSTFVLWLPVPGEVADDVEHPRPGRAFPPAVDPLAGLRTGGT